MPRPTLLRRPVFASTLLVFLAASGPAGAQTGSALTGAGPVNRSIAGASTALPLDAAGALYWNPATMTGLPRSEVDFGLAAIIQRGRLSSSYAFPGLTLAGTSTDADVVTIPNVAAVWKNPDSPLAFGVAVQGLAGFGIDYGVNLANPVTTPQPPLGIGFGGIFSDYQVQQIAFAAAYQVTDRWSVGIGPTVNIASLSANPFPFVPPDDANGDGVPTYPNGLRRDYAWGAGFQVGLYYTTPRGFNWGLSFKSPQWFEEFDIKSEDELGRPRNVQVTLDFPLIVSTGVAYTGLEHFQFALDIRYIDYKNTRGFGESGFDAQGALRGLGWNSVFVTAVGAQYDPDGPLSFRVGYTYNTNPIPGRSTAFNLASPSINEHAVYCGATYRVAESWSVSFMYGHGFKNAISGPLRTPAGPVPGTILRSRGSADEFTGGVSIYF